MVSFDEHTIPRWTRKFHIGKGYVTTRNKYMRCEKLFTGYDLVSGRFLSVRGTPGNCNLQELAVPLVQQVLRQGRPRQLARPVRCRRGQVGRGRAGVVGPGRATPQLGCHPARLSLPAPPACLEAIAQRPVRVGQEPGVCVGAPTKEVRLAETQTVLKDEARGAGGSHHRLPGGPTRSQERPLASVVHHQCGIPGGRVDDLPGPAKPRARPSGRGA